MLRDMAELEGGGEVVVDLSSIDENDLKIAKPAHLKIGLNIFFENQGGIP